MLYIHSTTPTKHLKINISTHPNTNEHITHNKHITKKGSISLFNKR